MRIRAFHQPILWLPTRSKVGFLALCSAADAVADSLFSYCETTGNTWAASTNGKIKSNKLCEMGNKRWSCHETEHCPNGASQLGMCLAPFPSPVEDVEVNETIEVLKLASLDAISRDRQTLFEPGKWCAGATHLMARMAAVLAVMAGLMLFVRRRRENARSSLMTGDIAQWSHEQFPGEKQVMI